MASAARTMPGSVAPLASCASAASVRIWRMIGSSATTSPGTRMPGAASGGMRQRYGPTCSTRIAYRRPRAQLAVTGDERRRVHASPIAAMMMPSTLASCGTRKAPSQKLSSRSASMAKRPIE